jgi:hypothetical protein
VKNPAQECVDDIVRHIGFVQEFVSKRWTIVSADDLFNKSVGLPFPCAGVVYEGLRPKQSPEGTGIVADLNCAIYLLYQSGSIGKVDNKPMAVLLLDDIRNKLKGVRSPSGHKWVFRFESPAEDMHKALVYYQRWSTTVIL